MTTLEETYADILDGPIKEAVALAAAVVHLSEEVLDGEPASIALGAFLSGVADLTLELLGELD